MPKRAKCKCQDPAAVAMLARISDKEKQGQPSLDVQCSETREMLIEPRGWHVVAEYRIKHRGSDLSRDPTYMRMIADARAGKFARLCLHKFDRFARRSYDREVFEHILTRECGVELHAALEPYDLATRAGQLTKKTSAFISDVFLDNLREESLKGMRQKVIMGGWPARAPFGYVNKREEIAHNRFRRWIETDPDTSPIVVVAFGLFASGQYTLDTLAAWLNDHGYLWAKGLPWRRDRVHRMLTNRFYTGLVRWNGIEAHGSHPVLVQEATFLTCTRILREHDEHRERHGRQIYPLNRLLWIDELQCGVHAEYHPNRGDARYYRSKAPLPDGSQLYLRCEDVEDSVGGLLSELEVPPALQAAIRRAYRQEVAEIASPRRSELDRLRQRARELEGENVGYIRLRAQGKISEEEFDRERQRVTAAIGTLRNELAALEAGGQGQMEALDTALAFAGEMGTAWSLADAAHRKLIAHSLFRRVSVDLQGRIVGRRLAPPFAYLESLKKAFSPPSRAGIPFGSRPLWATKPDTYRTGDGDLDILEEMSFPGKESLMRSGLLGRLT